MSVSKRTLAMYAIKQLLYAVVEASDITCVEMSLHQDHEEVCRGYRGRVVNQLTGEYRIDISVSMIKEESKNELSYGHIYERNESNY